MKNRFTKSLIALVSMLVVGLSAHAQLNIMQDDFTNSVTDITGQRPSQVGSNAWKTSGVGTISEDGEYADITASSGQAAGAYNAISLATGNLYTIRTSYQSNGTAGGYFAFGFTSGTSLGGKASGNYGPWIQISQQSSSGSGGTVTGYLGNAATTATTTLASSGYTGPIEATITWDTSTAPPIATFYLNNILVGKASTSSYGGQQFYAFFLGNGVGTASPAPIQVQSITTTSQPSPSGNTEAVWMGLPDPDNSSNLGRTTWWDPIFTTGFTNWYTAFSHAQVWTEATGFFLGSLTKNNNARLNTLETYFSFCYTNQIHTAMEVGGLPLVGGSNIFGGAGESSTDFTTAVSNIDYAYTDYCANNRSSPEIGHPWKIDYATVVNPFQTAIVQQPTGDPYAPASAANVASMAHAVANNVLPLVQAYPNIKIGESQGLSTIFNDYNEHGITSYAPFYEDWVSDFATNTVVVGTGNYPYALDHNFGIAPIASNPYVYGSLTPSVVNFLNSSNVSVSIWMNSGDFAWPNGSVNTANGFTNTDEMFAQSTMEHAQILNASGFWTNTGVKPCVRFENYDSSPQGSQYPLPMESIPETNLGSFFYPMDYYFTSPEATQPPPNQIVVLTSGSAPNYAYSASPTDANTLISSGWSLVYNTHPGGDRSPPELDDINSLWGVYPLPDCATGLEALYRYKNSTVGTYALSTGTGAPSGYSLDNTTPGGVIGYVWDRTTSGSQGGRIVYELYNATSNIYYYTDDIDTANAMVYTGSQWISVYTSGGSPAPAFYATPCFAPPAEGLLAPSVSNPVWGGGHGVD